MKALDYAIRTENWELAALCLVMGAVEAVRELPADAVEDLLSELDWAEQAHAAGAERARTPTGGKECRPRRHERVRGRRRGG